MSTESRCGPDFEQFLRVFLEVTHKGQIVVLTGAGISAESGIPTFRGAEGWWTVGSTVYQPQEIATRSFFRDNPLAVWGWYLYRRSLCHQAQPNAGHVALVQLAKHLADRMTLVTQNVDGLHLRAGSPAHATRQIHGNLDYMRCFAGCNRTLHELSTELPEAWLGWERHRLPTVEESAPLRCRSCGGWLRPHVLWFDEYYEEEFFQSDSSLASVQQADLLLVVGTSGATNLPMQMARLALGRGIPLLDIDPAGNAFSAMLEDTGGHLQAPAAQALPALVHARFEADADTGH